MVLLRQTGCLSLDFRSCKRKHSRGGATGKGTVGTPGEAVEHTMSAVGRPIQGMVCASCGMVWCGGGLPLCLSCGHIRGSVEAYLGRL